MIRPPSSHGPGYELLVTCDCMVEGRHYLPGNISPFDLGRRAMTLNISDIGAMGGRPLYALISLGLKAEIFVRDVEEMYRGFLAELNPFGASIIGGNLTSIGEWDVHRHYPDRGGGAGKGGAPFRGKARRCHPGYRISRPGGCRAATLASVHRMTRTYWDIHWSRFITPLLTGPNWGKRLPKPVVPQP